MGAAIATAFGRQVSLNTAEKAAEDNPLITGAEKAAEDNPLITGRYWVPTMTEEDLAKFTVPFAEVSQRLRAVLDEHGVALVVGVIPEEELAAFEAAFTDDLVELIDEEALREDTPSALLGREALEALRASGPRAFPVAASSKFTAAAGFCVNRCLAHGRFAWKARRHPNVEAVYRAIFPEAKALVSSMDVTFFTPEGQGPADSSDFCAHVDQNANDVRPGLSDCDSFQGVVYIWPSGADGWASTTTVWPGSHRSAWPRMMGDRRFASSGRYGSHYSEIRAMADRKLAAELAAGWAREARRAVVPAGGLFLWNSRTVHTGWRGGPRLAQTVCFQPTERRPEAERLAKLRLAALGLPGCHWASAGMQHDIVLGDPGYTARGPSKRVAGLPLKAAIRPSGLAEDADLDALSALADVDFKLTGMWDPPEGIAELLDASVKEEYSRHL